MPFLDQHHTATVPIAALQCPNVAMKKTQLLLSEHTDISNPI